MQVIPKDAPAPVPGQLSDAQKAAAKRESAIKAFMGNKAPQPPVSNPPTTPPAAATPEAPATPSDPTVTEFSAAQAAIKAEEDAKDGQVQDKVETKPAEATPESPKEPLSAQYAQLARKERALRAKALELKSREDALKSKETPAATPQEIDPSKYISVEEFRKHPWKYIKDAKISYDQVTQQALNEPSSETQELLSVIEEMRGEISSLKDEHTKTKSSWEDNQKQQYNQALKQIESEVTQLVESNPEYEAVKATGSVKDVVDLIEKTFQEDKILLSVEEATKQVEDFLAEEAYKLSQLKKIQKRLKPAAPAESATQKQPGVDGTKQPQQTKTLSNTMTASRQLSARDRAIAAAQHGPGWREKV